MAQKTAAAPYLAGLGGEFIMTSDLWGPIKNHLERINGHMPAVHHYTSLSGALGILETGRLWFTERSHLNDRQEISLGIGICEDVLLSQDRASDARQFREEVQNIFARFRFFSASFSFPMNDNNQWRDYADGGRGVVLSFKASAFNNPEQHINGLIPDNPTANAIVAPMSYGEAGLRTVIEEIAATWKTGNVSELCDHILFISSLFKGDCWRSENEYRFFIHHPRDRILRNPHHKMRERNGELVSYLDLPIQNWNSSDDFPIYRICPGPMAAANLAAQIRDFIFSNGIPIQDHQVSELF